MYFLSISFQVLKRNLHHDLIMDVENDPVPGGIEIEQDFTPDNYTAFVAQGNNYNVLFYDTQKEAIIEDKMKSSHFTGEYTMKENGEMMRTSDLKEFAQLHNLKLITIKALKEYRTAHNC